uniref:Uncharacterized protein n=1 Tax=Picea glauca TaxID=3330 RepID=A0A101LVB6_PICGL|nr:hypothetical protein ABT39_MTgene2125 [Picea glauca]
MNPIQPAIVKVFLHTCSKEELQVSKSLEHKRKKGTDVPQLKDSHNTNNSDWKCYNQ